MKKNQLFSKLSIDKQTQPDSMAKVRPARWQQFKSVNMPGPYHLVITSFTLHVFP